MSANAKPNEIALTRLYNAPVKAVWDAWIDPAQVAQWWGPRGFSITTKHKHVRPGGTWEYTMHGPDGVDYPNIATYHEVEPYALLVYDHGATPTTPPLFRVRVEFQTVGAATEMRMVMTLATAEAAERTKGFIKQANGNSTWDRLAEYLDETLHQKQRFVIQRSLAAPIEQVYAMWTTPAHLAAWLPPTGFTMEFIEIDLRQGGRSFYRMSNGADVTMYGKAEYRELTPPTKLVYTQQFADEKGNLARHPMAPVWPATKLTTVEFFAEGPNQTRICITWEPFGETTAEETAMFVSARSSMTGGWTGSFDKLEAYLATHSA